MSATQEQARNAGYAAAADSSAVLLSPQEVAMLRGVALHSVYAILQNEERRARIFPGALSQGKGKRRTWLIPAHEAEAWNPVRGRGRKKHLAE